MGRTIATQHTFARFEFLEENKHGANVAVDGFWVVQSFNVNAHSNAHINPHANVLDRDKAGGTFLIQYYWVTRVKDF